MNTDEQTKLRIATSKLLDARAAFLSLFEDAVVSILPPVERAIVARAIERDADTKNETPVLAAIYRHALASRDVILNERQTDDANTFIDEMMQDAAEEVCMIVKGGQGNVTRLFV